MTQESAEVPTSRGSGVAVLRWILVVPGWLVAAIVGSTLVNFINRLMIHWNGADEDSFFSQLYVWGMGGVAMGAGGVFAGAKIAPSHKRLVALALGLLTIIGLVVLFIKFRGAYIADGGWGIYSLVWTLVGAGAVSWSVYKGEVSEAEL